MNILILNQHSSNHGDEAAGKALLRGFRNFGIEDYISILYNSNKLLEIEMLNIDEKTRHFCSGKATTIDKVLIILTFLLPFGFIKYFYNFGTTTKYEYNLIKKYNKVINAPGGVNIGPYKDWIYLWRLYIAIKLKKDVALYSISFGPIPESYLFKKISKYVLSNVSFLSLRDGMSQKYADNLKLNYIKSIDTAFLNNNTLLSIPEEIKNIIKSDYVVFVPNELNKWHPYFKNIDSSIFDDIYLKIINYFINQNIQIVLLPQLFGTQNDSNYFVRLKEKSLNKYYVTVVSNTYSSDIQQNIIKRSIFLVGARYHSIIFAINNERPFLSISYEHKMTNTLELIGLDKYNILIQDIIDNKINISDKLNTNYHKRNEIVMDIVKARNNANKIAIQTLQLLLDKYLLV